MKIIVIRRKIIVAASVFVVLAATLAADITHMIYQSDSSKQLIEKVSSEVSQISVKTSELRTKKLEIKKYTALWKEIPDNKKSLVGIKMSDVNSTLSDVADKYSISNHVIKVNLPEVIESGIFNRKTIITNITTASLTFDSLDDVKALLFISEFFNRIPGYKVATSMSIVKTKDYSQSDFVDISLGKPDAASVRGKIDFIWYTYRDKNDPALISSAPRNEASENGNKL